MIRNLFILDGTGQSLLTVNFGECHSLGDDKQVISGFISAVHSFSKMVAGSGADEIRLGALIFMIKQINDILFVVTSDKDNKSENHEKVDSIVSLFEELYSDVISHGDNLSEGMFEGFDQILVDRGITDKNCGAFPDCTDCENRGKTIPLEKWAEMRT